MIARLLDRLDDDLKEKFIQGCNAVSDVLDEYGDRIDADPQLDYFNMRTSEVSRA